MIPQKQHMHICTHEHADTCSKLRRATGKKAPHAVSRQASAVVAKLPRGAECKTLASYFASVENFKRFNCG